MAYRSSNPWEQRKQDTGWGLIFRLNLLMGKIENDVERSDLDKWNLHIDRIFINTHYKNDYEIVLDKEGKPCDVKFSKEDVEIFSRFAKRIEEIKKDIYNSRFIEDESEKRKKIFEAQTALYNIIFKKDLWIRKVMFKLKLYLRENESNPAKAIYNG